MPIPPIPPLPPGAHRELDNLQNVAINAHVKPDTDNAYDLGDSTPLRFKDLYLAGNLTDNTNSLTIANAKTAYDHSQIVTGNPHILDHADVGAIEDAADAIKDTHIDWGGGAGQVNLDDVPDGTSYEKVAANQLSGGIYIDATTSVKGIASFNTTYFTVSLGAVTPKHCRTISFQFGGAGSTTTSTTYVTVANSDIAIDPSDFMPGSALYVRFFYHLKNQTSGKTAFIRVWKQDAGTIVSNSEEQCEGTAWNFEDTSWLDWSSESGHESYQIQIKTDSGGTTEFNSALMILSWVGY